MSSNQQIKKVKKYRTLKVVFYFMGLPLFIIAVLLSAIPFIGRDPFMGSATLMGNFGMLTAHESMLTAPALFGIWLAFGVWLIISIIHLILSKTVKSRRARMFSMIAVVLVIMLGGTLVMDTIFDAKIDQMIAEHEGDGVTIEDYRTQLSYYRTVSSFASGRNRTKQLIDQVETLQKVYHITYNADNRSGLAANISNKPATYYNVIDDEGNIGVDISYKRDENNQLVLDIDENGMHTPDGVITESVEGNRVIRIKPDGNGQLVINGKVYSKYFYCMRTLTTGEQIYVWYPLYLMPTTFDWNAAAGTGSSKATDGIYGEALYNENGTLSEGWIFSMENVLEILEDYYEAQEFITEYEKNADNLLNYAYIVSDAEMNRDLYYSGQLEDPETGELCDPWLQAHYQQQNAYETRFSVTRDDLDKLVAELGDILGKNQLFTYLFGHIDSIGGLLGTFDEGLGQVLGPLLTNLGKGMSLRSLIGSFITDPAQLDGIMGTVNTVFTYLTPNEIKEIYICFAYDTEDCFGNFRDHMYLAVFNHDPALDSDGHVNISPDEAILDIDFRNYDDDDNIAFELDHLSEFLNKTLNYLLDEKLNLNLNDGILRTILDLFIKDIPVTREDGTTETYRGLDISGIKIPIFNEEGKIDLDIEAILYNLLQNYYSYTSVAIKPVWEFYDWAASDNESYVTAQRMYKQFAKAQYLATTYGTMIGSTLIGDNLGTGNYPAAFGLSSLQAVRQLKTDLSYKRVYYPLFAFRDMLLMFSGIVTLFYFLSFVAAEKEEKFATGELIPKNADITDYEHMGATPDEHIILEEVRPENAGSPKIEGEPGANTPKNKKDKKDKGKKDKGGKKPAAKKEGAKTPASKNKGKGVK